MMRQSRYGMTLVELVIAIAIMAVIAGAATGILTSALQAEAHGMSKSQLHTEGLLAMERMSNAIRVSTSVLVPNAHTPSRDVLAVTGLINDDGDSYFNDPLFPRIDEDPGTELVDDNKTGIEGIDDDGDGSIDEGGTNDDDEDGTADEDPINGIDDDGDGSLDEDPGSDVTDDGESGILGMDDDGDGTVDNGQTNKDDDEDGSFDEDPLDAVVYSFDSPTTTLTESVPATAASTPLSSQVTQFEAFFEGPERIRLTLTLTGTDGENVTFVEYAFPRNVLQKTGKRVR
jgi:prepilin-type N-terminal cleavage/methylation domain-containing protein